MAGYNYTDGEISVPSDDIDKNGVVLLPNTTHGGYLGAFALKPLNDNWTVMSFAGGAKASDNYSSYWFGAGIGYKINQHQSVNCYGFMSDNDYGENKKLGFSYTYEFD